MCFVGTSGDIARASEPIDAVQGKEPIVQGLR
jgi:hypothetical protein